MVSILKANSPILLTKFADFGEQIRRFWFHNPYLCRSQPLLLPQSTLTFAAANPYLCRSQPLLLPQPTLTIVAAGTKKKDCCTSSCNSPSVKILTVWDG